MNVRNENVAAVIVCFNPDIERLKCNIAAVINQVERILVIDNNSNNYFEYSKYFTNNLKVEFLRLDRNKGIAVALNLGLKRCVELSCKWMLSLDQDSVCENDMIQELFKCLDNYKRVGILAPMIIDINNPNKIYSKFKRNSSTAITSGCLNDVEIASKIGGFEDKMFIDAVDHEFSLRMLTNGYKIKHCQYAILHHEVGAISKHRLLFFTVITMNHKPFRRYFMYRNRIFLYKKYFFKAPCWVLKNILVSIKEFIYIILFEVDKKKKISCILMGIKDGLKDNFDNETIFSFCK